MVARVPEEAENYVLVVQRKIQNCPAVADDPIPRKQRAKPYFILDSKVNGSPLTGAMATGVGIEFAICFGLRGQCYFCTSGLVAGCSVRLQPSDALIAHDLLLLGPIKLSAKV
jgi:hypothetical protein